MTPLKKANRKKREVGTIIRTIEQPMLPRLGGCSDGLNFV